jgi:hypothetical protein
VARIASRVAGIIGDWAVGGIDNGESGDVTVGERRGEDGEGNGLVKRGSWWEGDGNGTSPVAYRARIAPRSAKVKPRLTTKWIRRVI